MRGAGLFGVQAHSMTWVHNAYDKMPSQISYISRQLHLLTIYPQTGSTGAFTDCIAQPSCSLLVMLPIDIVKQLPKSAQLQCRIR